MGRELFPPRMPYRAGASQRAAAPCRASGHFAGGQGNVVGEVSTLQQRTLVPWNTSTSMRMTRITRTTMRPQGKGNIRIATVTSP